MISIFIHLSYAQDELYWSLFVRRPCVHSLTFLKNFSETAEPVLLKFHMEPP